MKISVEKAIARIDELYEFGLKPDGSHTRMAFSIEDKKGRERFMDYFRAIGIEPVIDTAGNIIARMEGQNPELPPIVMGSHLDTVPDGGKYDGVLGCIGGLAICEAFYDQHKIPKHPLEVIVFTDEEGFRFGSGMYGSSALCGKDLAVAGSDTDVYGETRTEVLKRCGLSLEQVGAARRAKDTVHCFLELHIEQGGRLDNNKIPIGVVTSIAGVSRSEIQIIGEANHSGSTAMSARKDALVTAAELISELPHLVSRYGHEFTVATVGTIQVSPGSVNVVPGSCTFCLEIRDQDEQIIRELEDKCAAYIKERCDSGGLTYEIKCLSYHDPSPMTEWVVEQIEQAVQEEGLLYEKIPSGAFHDSLVMAEVFPTGMIFVPSVNGISHSRHEYTRQADIERGLNVLLRTVEQIDHIK